MNAEISYPSIPRRYLATAIDGCIILGGFVMVSYLAQGDSRFAQALRIASLLFFFLVYEPLSTSRLCTIGQKLMRIRVRDHATMSHITLPQAYFRLFIKIILGFISFFTLGFNAERRAIHDLAARSVVVNA